MPIVVDNKILHQYPGSGAPILSADYWTEFLMTDTKYLILKNADKPEWYTSTDSIGTSLNPHASLIEQTTYLYLLCSKI